MAKYVLPPRQKMINLLYVILIAMLAINVSSDVLVGYDLMDKQLRQRISGTERYIDTLRQQIDARHLPSLSHASAQQYDRTRQMQNLLDSLREAIAQRADNDKYQPGKLHARDDLNAVPVVMLSATGGKGKMLKDAITAFRDSSLQLIGDNALRDYIGSFLSLGSSTRGMTWERETFSYLSAIGGVMMLNRLEEAVVQMSAEVQASLLEQDIAGKKTGSGTYMLINENQRIVDDNGMFDTPVVLVSPSITNTLYAGYSNTLNIFCAGIPYDQLRFYTADGKVVRQGGRCIITPAPGITKLSLNVGFMRNGKHEHLCDYKFDIKPLPDPSAYISYRAQDGSTRRYYGSVPISRNDLQNIISVGAYTGRELGISYTVNSFETVMIKNGSGQITSEHTRGNKLSQSQRQQISQLASGDKFYITSIVVTAPDGKTRQTSPISMVIL